MRLLTWPGHMMSCAGTAAGLPAIVTAHCSPLPSLGELQSSRLAQCSPMNDAAASDVSCCVILPASRHQ